MMVEGRKQDKEEEDRRSKRKREKRGVWGRERLGEKKRTMRKPSQYHPFYEISNHGVCKPTTCVISILIPL